MSEQCFEEIVLVLLSTGLFWLVRRARHILVALLNPTSFRSVWLVQFTVSACQCLLEPSRLPKQLKAVDRLG